MRRLILIASVLVLVIGIVIYRAPARVAHAGQGSPGSASPAELDRLLAPIALYPDQLLAQMLLCAQDPAGVTALDRFLKSNANLKGSDLQDAALKDNFEPHYVAMALFPQVIGAMAANLDATTKVGQAFAADKSAVFASIQRLRKQAHDVGNLKTTSQQQVETQTTSGGQEVIVIEPANPQVIYVPQYNTQTVYVQTAPPATTVVVQDNSADAAAAAMIGFTAGVVIGAAVNNNYYYGPYGWHGGVHMYNDAWDDWYDHREDAREDWMDHREDVMENRSDRAEDAREQRSDRTETRADTRSDTQQQRTERQENRSENRPEAQQQRTERQQNRQASGQQRTGTAQTQSATASRGSGSYEARGQSGTTASTPRADRSGTKSDAFSGYSSGRSERAASSRGQSSRSSARSSGSRSGGGRRR
jgi:hypothetical protein